jgi:hypothetical protein
MPKIFISYRRAESRAHAGRLYDRLVAAFGVENVFMDVNNDNIPLGRDFRGVLRESVAQCDVLLAIIGKQWLTIIDEDSVRRLDNPNDFVRIEIESALQRGNCLVIPVTVDNALIPGAKDLPETLRELSFKNGTTLRDDPDFHNDAQKIIRALEGIDSKGPHIINLQSSPITTQPSAVAFNVYDAIDRYHDIADAKKWEDARRILNEIRASGVKIPRTFNIDSYEKEVWEEIEAEEREREYNILRRMAKAQKPNGTRIWEALQAFWESYPLYDPDGLVRFKPKPPIIKNVPTISKGSNAQYYIDRAQEHRSKGNYSEAITDYTEAIRINPQDAYAHNNRGVSYHAKQDYIHAIADYSEAIRLNTQYAYAYANRANSYLAIEDYAHAIADYETALKIDPKQPLVAQSLKDLRNRLM